MADLISRIFHIALVIVGMTAALPAVAEHLPKPRISMTCPDSFGSPLPGWGNTTYIDSRPSQQLTPGGNVTGLQFYSTVAQTVTLKIIKKNSATNVDVVTSASLAHPGGSAWATAPLTFAVPSTGEYYVGVYVANTTNVPVSGGFTGQYAAGDISGSGVTVATAAANYPPVCVVYDGAPPPSPPPTGNTLVIIGAGQSLIACYNGTAPYAVRHAGHVKSLNGGSLVAVTNGNPAGCDGTANTFLVPLADDILDDGRFTDVVIVPIAVGGTYIADWAAGGVYNGRISTAFSQLASLGLSSSVTLFLWEQGTQDALTDAIPSVLLAKMQSIIATVRASSSAPIFIAREGRANGIALGTDAARAVQLAPVNNVDVLKGPDVDQLGNEYRLPDRIHIDDYPAQARLWKIPIDKYLAAH